MQPAQPGPDRPEDPQTPRSQPGPGGPPDPAATSGGVLGARPLLVSTFHGRDPDTVAGLDHLRSHPHQVPGPHAPVPGWKARA